MIRQSVCISFLLFIPLLTKVVAQCPNVAEICNNGIDDDCDGLIDCFDGDCASSLSCENFYFGRDSGDCQVAPPVVTGYNLVEVWSSIPDVETRGTPIVGDLDGDGIPEVVTHFRDENTVYILNGVDGSIKSTIDAHLSEYSQSPAIADINNDGFAEIFMVDHFGKLLCFDHTGAAKGGFSTTTISKGQGTYQGVFSANPNFADFNGDGKVELFIGNQIFSASTGLVLAELADPYNSSKGAVGINGHSFPAAFDILPDGFCSDCSGLELICGDVVYAVNIATGQLTKVAEAPGNSNDGKVSLADWNGDGQMDIIVSTSCCGNGGSIYIWDPRTQQYLTNDAQGNALLNNPVDVQATQNTQVGLASIADFDGDGFLEMGMAGRNEFVVLDGDLSRKWSIPVVDASNMTTSTAFDFEGDGKTEVVYRDENYLYILDGATGTEITKVKCGSATRTDLPVVVDVNGDGDAEIVCTCSDQDGGGKGKVRVYESDSTIWVPTRKLWNSHNYVPSFVNDNLTIPKEFQNKALVKGQDLYLAQTSLTYKSGNPVYPVLPDYTLTIDSISTNCIAQTMTAHVEVCQRKANALVFDFELAFYKDDPKIGGQLLGKTRIDASATPIAQNQCIKQDYNVEWNDYELFVYVNDQGTDPRNAPIILMPECDTTNNVVSQAVTVNQSNITLGPDTTICEEDSVLLDAGPTGTSYTWNDGSTGQTLNAKTGGVYNVSVTLPSGCVAKDTLIVTTQPCTVEHFVHDTLYLCKGDSLSIVAQNHAGGSWASNELFLTLNDSTVRVSPSDTAVYCFESYALTQNFLVNSDFETPDLAGWGVKFVAANEIAGWHTTDSRNEIEVWSNANNEGVVAYTGNQFVELNAHENAALYQDIPTTPGTRLRWSFAHIGRYGAETMSLEIGPPGGPYTQVGTFTDGTSAWGTYSDVYQIPAGQTTSRFYFRAITGGAAGNFLDAIKFNSFIENKDSVVVIVDSLPQVDLGRDTLICSDSSTVLSAPAGSYNYLWSTGAQNASITVSAASEYWLQLEDAKGCKGRDTIEVKNEPCFVNLIEPDSIFYCEKDSATIGAHFVQNGIWTSQGNHSIVDDSTIKVFDDYTGWYFYGELNGAINDSVFVLVHPKPLLELQQNTSFCDGQEVTISPLADAQFFNWSDGQTTKSAIFSRAGNYKLEVTDVHGCKSLDSIDIFIDTVPVITLPEDTILCQGDSIILSYPEDGSGLIWSTGESSNEIWVKTTGLYLLSVTNSFGCSSTDSFELNLKEPPEIDLGPDTILCKKQTLELNVNLPNLFPKWNTGSTAATITVASPGLYWVEVQDEIQCTSKDTIFVEYDSVPDLYPKKTFQLCQGDTISITPQTYPDSIIVVWEPQRTTGDSLVTFEAGLFTSVVSSPHCSDSFKIEVSVIDTPMIEILNLQGKESFCFNYEQATLIIEGRDKNLLTGRIWLPDSSRGTEFVADSAGTFTLISSIGECESINSIDMKEYCQPIIYVPNAFSPNGDGKNDVFLPIIDQVETYQLFIYNRWGELIFSSSNYAEGWEGLDRFGSPYPIGVYVYKIFVEHFSFHNGKISFEKVGTITLVR